MAETFRSGLETIEPIQRESAVSLGLSNRQTMQYVILPQAMSVSVPAFVANVIFFVEGDECVQCHQFDGFDVYSQRFNWSVLQNNRESVFARRLLPDHSASSVNSGQSVGKRGCAMPDLGLDVLLKRKQHDSSAARYVGSTANQSHFYCNQHAAWEFLLEH